MSDIATDIFRHLDSSRLEQIASTVGLGPNQAKGAVGLAVPFLVNALSQNASTPAGAQA